MISGSTTNSASDGIVKMMLAVTVVSRRSSGGPLHQRAERHRDQQPEHHRDQRQPQVDDRQRPRVVEIV